MLLDRVLQVLQGCIVRHLVTLESRDLNPRIVGLTSNWASSYSTVSAVTLNVPWALSAWPISKYRTATSARWTMHCAYKERTDTSGSLTNEWMLGMIYSGNIDALAGVMTFTSDSFVMISLWTHNYTRVLTTCKSVLRAAARTTAASSRRRSTIYGTNRSSFASSVRWTDNARKTSNARNLLDG